MGGDDSNKKVVAARRVKKGLQVVIWAACLFWFVWWFLSPDYNHLSDNTHSRFFRTDGRQGSILIYQTMPFVAVATLSFVVIELRNFIRSKEPITSYQKEKQKIRISSIKSYPFWVHSPIGVLTIAEFLFIIGVLFVMSYYFGRRIYFSFQKIDEGHVKHHLGPILPKAWQKVDRVAYNFGVVATIPFSLLWIPVSRGSPFLRLIGLPFDHAVKYHIWLATIMLIMVTLHSIVYIIFYVFTGQTQLIIGWVVEGDKCSLAAGLVGWVAGLVMWITSLSFLRRRWYEFFLGIHHLYIIFALFWLYHVAWNYHFFVIPILLFLVDRSLRMFQSRHLVDVLSAKVLDSGAIQLNLAKNDRDQGLVFYSLSTWCIHIPCLSKLQWHFFSATSTPTKQDKEVSIIIKPVGKWTRMLHNQLKASSDTKQSSSICPFSFKARVEGPYGDETDFYLKYQTLVLVAGGIGVTPLLAILRDILHRHKRAQPKSLNLPISIEVYHCVRMPEELCVLNEIDPNQIFPDYDKLGLNIQVHVYITSEVIENYDSQLAVHASRGDKEALDLAKFGGLYSKSSMRYISPISGAKTQGVSCIATMGDTKWIASISISSMVGYFVLSGLANLFIVKSYNYNFSNYNRVHIVVACMFLGTFLFGGAMLMIWLVHIKQSKERFSLVQPKTHSTTSSPSTYLWQDFCHDNEASVCCEGGSPWNGDLHLCHRPVWKDVFNHLSNQYKGQSVGVLVSGSQGMREDVASECRRHSQFLLAITPQNVAFDFHSVSFEL